MCTSVEMKAMVISVKHRLNWMEATKNHIVWYDEIIRKGFSLQLNRYKITIFDGMSDEKQHKLHAVFFSSSVCVDVFRAIFKNRTIRKLPNGQKTCNVFYDRTLISMFSTFVCKNCSLRNVKAIPLHLFPLVRNEIRKNMFALTFERIEWSTKKKEAKENTTKHQIVQPDFRFCI